MKEWVTKNILQLIIIAGFVIFGVVTCNKGGWGGNTPKADTVYTTRVDYIPQPPVYIPQYIPIQSNSQAPIVIPPQYQPSQDLTTLLKQYNELVNKHLAQNTYKVFWAKCLLTNSLYCFSRVVKSCEG